MAFYEPIVPPQVAGQGNLTAYRAISSDHRAQILSTVAESGRLAEETPARWVRQQPLFAHFVANDAAPSPAGRLRYAEERRLAMLAARLAEEHPSQLDDLYKLWAECAYETLRPLDALSRLDALYAFADPLDAFCFLDRNPGARYVWEVQVNDGVDWIVVDMAAFVVERPFPVTPRALGECRTRILENVPAYWHPDECRLPEILIGGAVTYVRELALSATLVQSGVLPASRAVEPAMSIRKVAMTVTLGKVSLRAVTDANRAELEALRADPTYLPWSGSVTACLREAAAPGDIRSECWAIYSEETPVGFVMIQDWVEEDGSDSPPGLYALLIDERYQGRSLGSTAVDLLVALLRERDVPAIWTVVNEGDGSPIPFFQKCGFEMNEASGGRAALILLL